MNNTENSKGDLSLHDSYFTSGEINGQPDLWRKVADQILGDKSGIKSFISGISGEIDSIILTGAGTSAYVGLSLQGLFNRKFRINTVIAPTTDIVTYPEDYFSSDGAILLVSFARSGNSPESKAAVELADALCGKCYHLIITCDENGLLAKYESKNKKYLVVLPPESNDKGLAMTGSYSGMLLAGVLIANIYDLVPVISQVDLLCNYGSKILDQYTLPLKQIAGRKFERALFLGSGPFFGTATESHLKLQELTDGIVICKQESFLGLRHGPKAIIHSDTLVSYIFSNNDYVNKYEMDLVKAIAKDHKPASQIGICENPVGGMNLDLLITLSESNSRIDENLLAVCYILPSQILGFYKSLELGLNPDKPSLNNTISRVVEGVTIYNYTNGK
jgi:tagatose-6-phosphate ketose/aldose isomerase